MNRPSRPWVRTVIALTTPPARVLGFVLRTMHSVLFRWWLDKRLVKKSNEKFAHEIREELPFLFSEYGAEVIPNDREPRASFDFAYVTVSVAGLILRFCRGLGTTSIDVSSARNSDKSHDLSSVLNLIDGEVRRQSYSCLLEVEPLLRSHMKELIAAFSERNYDNVNRRLSDVYAHDRAATRQWEAEINRRLYPDE
jgi:hypothetical protein